MSFRPIFLLTALCCLFSCSSSISRYENTAPSLVIEEFFNGELTAHGIVKNYRGHVVRHFNATIRASWNEGIGTLDEDFIFDDGETQKRIWTITPNEPINGKRNKTPSSISHYTAVAGDVIGEAPVSVTGNSMFLSYLLTIPYKNDTINVKVDDKMFLVNESTIINESTLHKFGLAVGSITLTILKQTDNGLSP